MLEFVDYIKNKVSLINIAKILSSLTSCHGEEWWDQQMPQCSLIELSKYVRCCSVRCLQKRTAQERSTDFYLVLGLKLFSNQDSTFFEWWLLDSLITFFVLMDRYQQLSQLWCWSSLCTWWLPQLLTILALSFCMQRFLFSVAWSSTSHSLPAKFASPSLVSIWSHV